ncbi:MAG TPA: prolyl oligopeptidase family serine peptidase [Terriglobales bacterium]|nr:prolyl oligopeptidase family serine peptidase [Terriglobales bacterium]
MASISTSIKPPAVEKRVVEETLHGVTVRDPFRYLEDANAPETQRFAEEQNAWTRSLLDRVPGSDQIRARLEELLSIGVLSAPQIGGKYYFYTKREGRQNQPVLYVREGLQGSDRALVDVNTWNAQGMTALDWWYSSHDGKYVCFGTSENGSEISDLQVIESETRKLLPAKIRRTRAASVAWKHDNSGFFYTRYPNPGEVPPGEEVYYRKVFFHSLTDAADGSQDKLVFFYDKDPQGWPNVSISDDDRWLVIGVSHGWTRVSLFLKDLNSDGEPFEITEGKDFLYGGEIYAGHLYLATNEDAPRFRVFKVDVTKPARQNWREIIPQSSGSRGAVLQGAHVIGGKLVVTYEKDVTAGIKIFDLEGKWLNDVTMPGIGSLAGVGGNHDSDEAFFDFQSFTVPTTVYHVDMKDTGAHVTPWQVLHAPIDCKRYLVKQLFYPSRDATQIPIFVVHRADLKLDGNNPTWLSGYGGFNVSNSPTFRSSVLVWLEQGGVFALANLRGGSEYGEDWHRAGMLDRKQTVFDDFIAAAEYLIREKYTNPQRLAIQGGSNGGLLVGAVLTQRPELFRAMVCQVPLLDMLRYQNFQIAKLWIPEYGSADDPEQFKWIYAYSPYHHVKPGRQYPAVLFMTADTDTRVDPMHAKKMAALLQTEAANGQSAERPILLRIETKAGHGAGKPLSKQVEELTDMFAFLTWQLGICLSE